ncbi:MAG: Asp-tRNA(Asn)/Glu-tRNA(Gln) amidotransferase subunit GatB [Puniceicoccales bacterium]|jgi:aspartyl-tRNA(Asn)/glutamyl-tRNA(Gln) amidotransferase subunit B|nr:Asp-tRNA(Asn)/Glu-tRNA(Gln) amidotransferase subunit GatB [Puniceicoccales bacterium]
MESIYRCENENAVEQSTGYEMVIGVEVHVQLATESKAFSPSRCCYGEEPNSATDPVVMGLPGALPVINYGAIRQTARAGLMLHCKIAKACSWDRKNYFYPDSPKNYQITQQEQPLCVGGYVEIELPGPSRNIMGIHRNVKLNRIHLEEDVGKLTHYSNYSLIDFNRAGTPLMEIVSEPDLYSADEVAAFLNAIRMSMESAGISHCNMEKGEMRCDVNVSIRPSGSKKLGMRAELKNLNSISGIQEAIKYEVSRQVQILQSGGTLYQETRRWNAQLSISESMRRKENAQDYCYFPEPDLMPVYLSKDIVDQWEKELPERTYDCQRRFMKQYGLPYTITSVLCFHLPLAIFFEKAVQFCGNARAIANLIVNDLLREISQIGRSTSDFPVSAESLAHLVRLVDDGAISKQASQDVLAEICKNGGDVTEVIKRLGHGQNQNSDALESICRQAIGTSEKAVAEFLSGKENAINAIKGKVMKISQGKADPKRIDCMLRSLLQQS